jgi:hypothetical protein
MGPKSLFAIPLNAKHRHFNASGQQRALLATTTNLPLLLNAFHNVDFVFKNDFNFSERVGPVEDQDPRIHPIWLAELRKNLEPRIEIALQKRS